MTPGIVSKTSAGRDKGRVSICSFDIVPWEEVNATPKVLSKFDDAVILIVGSVVVSSPPA